MNLVRLKSKIEEELSHTFYRTLWIQWEDAYLEPHNFSETEVNLITTVANQAAVAIMNTELMVKTRVIEEELETRKMVERAKEVLMLKRNKTGEEAYQWIRKRSMDTRKSMRTVAEAVLLSEELE